MLRKNLSQETIRTTLTPWDMPKKALDLQAPGRTSEHENKNASAPAIAVHDDPMPWTDRAKNNTE